MTLLEAKSGRPVRILEIADAQALRVDNRALADTQSNALGARLRVGPVLVRHQDSEVCLGRELAGRILVEEAPEANLRPGRGGMHGRRAQRDRRRWRFGSKRGGPR